MGPKKPVGRPKKVVATKNSAKVEKPPVTGTGRQTPIAKGKTWTDDNEQQLADLWQSEPHMYDWGEKDSTNQEVCESALRSFCEKLGRTGECIFVVISNTR